MLKKIQYKNVNYFQDSSLFRASSSLRIGVYGGSFNPPHQGHLYVSNSAKQRFNLNLIFWLVAPLNPLKSKQDMSSIGTRISLCNKIIGYSPYIKAVALEQAFSHNYSYLSLALIKKLSNHNDIYWIMGEDNLANFHLFENWQHIIENFNIVVFARGKSSYSSLLQKSSFLYKNKQISYFNNEKTIDKSNSEKLLSEETCLRFVLQPRNNISSTIIRKQ